MKCSVLEDASLSIFLSQFIFDRFVFKDMYMFQGLV